MSPARLRLIIASLPRSFTLSDKSAKDIKEDRRKTATTTTMKETRKAKQPKANSRPETCGFFGGLGSLRTSFNPFA